MLNPEAVETGGSKPYYQGAHSLKRKTKRKKIIISDIVEIFKNLMGTLRETGKVWLWKLRRVSQRGWWYWRGVEKWDGGILDGQNGQSVKGSECKYRKFPTYQSSSCKLSKMRKCIPSTSGVSEIAADPLSPLADDPSAPSSPTFLPLPVSNSSCPLIQCQPLYASCCTALLYFSRYSTVRLKMSIFCFYVLFVWKVLKTYYSTVIHSQPC